jgi:MEMO1 family protein
MQHTRKPAFAGSFYPEHAGVLQSQVDALLAASRAEAAPRRPKILIAPHAGYVYSGPIAASAYALLAAYSAQIRRVLLLGPAHRAPVRGLALPASDAFLTPLGMVRIDTEAAKLAQSLPSVCVDEAAHVLEHALEVHLPFLQTVLDEFGLLPFAVGDAGADEVAQVLDALWGGDETLIVISSDLSHYLPYERACAVDAVTAETVVRMRGPINHEQACGATPINGLLVAARRRGLEPALLDLRNSGDTAGDRSRVVGYAAFAFYEPDRN